MTSYIDVSREPVVSTIAVGDFLTASWLGDCGVQGDRVVVSVGGDRRLSVAAGLATGRRVLWCESRMLSGYSYRWAVEELAGVWGWLLDEVGVAANSVAVLGDSAGGNLLSGLLRVSVAEGREIPGEGVMVSPARRWTLRGVQGAGSAFTAPVLRDMFAAYPSTSGGLPPYLVQVATADALVAEWPGFARAAVDSALSAKLRIPVDG
ncbi:alpha/beta hydrolase fold domain-containing protein [Nocardia heshunensis]